MGIKTIPCSRLMHIAQHLPKSIHYSGSLYLIFVVLSLNLVSVFVIIDVPVITLSAFSSAVCSMTFGCLNKPTKHLQPLILYFCYLNIQTCII